MAKSPTYKTVRDFIEAVGRSNFQDSLGHSTQVITRAIADDTMPAHWYVPVRDWCAEIGIVAPEHLFKWSRKPPAVPTQFANGESQFQGAETEKVNEARQ